MLGGAAGLVAGGLLACSFLAVHYSHLALDDAPTLAPVCLTLLGVASIYRHNRARDYALAGLGLGIACAFKYTAGVVILSVIAAALVSPTAGARVRGLVVAGACALVGFLVFNPFALLDFSAFRDGLQHQSETSSDGGGKLGLSQSSGILYYAGTTTWGLGWLPGLAALGGAAGTLATNRRLAAMLVPPPLALGLFMGVQDRFFARWLLPAYPLLCLLAGWTTVALGRRLHDRIRRGGPRPVVAAIGVLLCLQGAVFAIHNDLVLARPDTRQLARDWMVAHVPIRSKVVIEPFLPAAWAADAQSVTQGTGNGFRWNKWLTTRGRLPGQTGPAGVIRFEDYERTTRPALISSYTRGGFCWVVTGSTQYGRAYADPGAVPEAIAYYAALGREGRLVYDVKPTAKGGEPFSYDFSFNAYPLRYSRMGPEIKIYELHGDRC
jgi:hypothetical protein